MADDNSTQVTVDKAETVNVPGNDITMHPAVIYIVFFVTVGVLVGFAVLTVAILTADRGLDPATKGAVIQTWNNLAVAAAAVWTSSTLVNRLKGVK